jgi:hypothetical protein
MATFLIFGFGVENEFWLPAKATSKVVIAEALRYE